MGKQELSERLLALPKNTAVQERGLQTCQLRTSDETSLEVRYLHRPVSPPELLGGSSSQSPEVAANPTLVFVHGTPACLLDWVEVIFGSETLDSCDVWALDLPGHGLSEGLAEPTTFQACADLVGEFLAHHNLSEVTLIGQSYGGEVAWRCALDNEDRVSKLVLMNSSGYERADDEWLPEEELMREMWAAPYGYLLNSKPRIETALALHYQTELPADRLEEMFLLCENRANWRAMVDLCRDENGTRMLELKGLQQSTLLLWGKEDIAYPIGTIGRRFLEDLPTARLVAVKGAGHYPQGDQPERVAQELLEFVTEP